jgi:hypothetical protein
MGSCNELNPKSTLKWDNNGVMR